MSISDNIFAIADTIREVPDDSIRARLINLINELIKNDFPSLVQLLYRVDVEEKELKKLLKENSGIDTAPVIADIIIKRQIQKIETKKQFARKDHPPRKDEW